MSKQQIFYTGEFINSDHKIDPDKKKRYTCKRGLILNFKNKKAERVPKFTKVEWEDVEKIAQSLLKVNPGLDEAIICAIDDETYIKQIIAGIIQVIYYEQGEDKKAARLVNISKGTAKIETN